MVSINVIIGNSDVSEDDRDRAKAAALAVFAARGVTPVEAHAAFAREWDYLASYEAEENGLCQDYDSLRDPLSLAFIAATDAASTALTEGWANPGGAYCTLSV